MMATDLDISPVVVIVVDPRLDGVHRPGRRAARRAAHDRAAGRGRAVRGRPLVRRAPRAGAGRDRGRPVARPYNRCRAGPRRRRPRLVSGRVFRRSASANPPVAVEAHGSTIVDAEGREYLDAAGGAIVVNVGHGRREIADAIAEQAARLSYAHGSAFTTEALERYAAELGPHLPIDDPAIYPVCGGSEADRDRAQARPRDAAGPRRRRTAGSCSRAGAATTATRWARSTCPAAARSAAPYEGWLGRFRHVSAAYPYRGGRPGLAGAGDDAGARRRAGPRDLVGRTRHRVRLRRASRSSGRRSPPSSRPRATGRASRTSAATTACCSSPTRS